MGSSAPRSGGVCSGGGIDALLGNFGNALLLPHMASWLLVESELEHGRELALGRSVPYARSSFFHCLNLALRGRRAGSNPAGSSDGVTSAFGLGLFGIGSIQVAFLPTQCVH